MRFRKPTAPDPVIIQSLIALFDAIHSALHSLKNAVMVLPVTDSQGNEDLVAELSYCFSVENAAAVRAYGRSVQSLLKQLAGQQSQVESALTIFSPPLSEQLTSTIASLLHQGPEVAERINRFGLHAKRSLNAMTPEEREAFLPYAKAHLDALYGLLADDEEGLLHQVSRALEPFEVGSILSTAARPVRARAQALGIQMEIPTVSKRLRLQSNPQPLTEVLDGLLSNALDAVMEQAKTGAAGNHGEIRVAVQDSDGAIEIRIADNGCGLAPDRLQTIREGKRVTSKGKGRGNGLPSARQQLSGYHNASLDTESEGTGRGACAVVRLDLSPKSSGDSSPFRRRRLLLVAALAIVVLVAGLIGRLTNSTSALTTARNPQQEELRQLYGEGRVYWNRRKISDFQSAIIAFARANDLDRGDARPYSGLADIYALVGYHGDYPPTAWCPIAKRLAEKAVAKDPRLSESHASLAWIKMIYDWDWQGAKAEFQQAIDLDPKNVTARQWHSIYLAVQEGLDKGIAEAQEARRLEPELSPSTISNLAQFLRLDNKYPAAIALLQTDSQTHADFYRGHYELGRVHLQKGDYPAAIESLDQAVKLSNRSARPLAVLGLAYARLGQTGEAKKILHQLQERRNQWEKSRGTGQIRKSNEIVHINLDEHKYVSPYHIAVVHIGLGHREEAMTWLEKALPEKPGVLIYLKMEPFFESLREEPRFKAMLKNTYPEE